MQPTPAQKPTQKLIDKDYITSIYIVKTEDSRFHPMYCMDCRNMLCKHNGEVVMVAPGLDVVDAATVVIECTNPNCRRRYQIISKVEAI